MREVIRIKSGRLNYSDKITLFAGKKTKRELCLFNSTIASFESLLFAKHNIRTLIIIGQRNISLLSAIAELIHIQELWIVECGIEVIKRINFAL